MNHSRKRRLRFSAETDKIHYCKDRIPLTKEEIGSIWYNKSDERQMRNEAKILALKHRFISERSFIGNSFQCNKSKNTDCQLLPQQQLSEEILQKNYFSFINEESVDEFRGLEYIIHRERQMDKNMVVRIILSSQHKLNSLIAIAAQKNDPNLNSMIKMAPRKLAMISFECTRWARNIALARGKLDCTEVYENNVEPNANLSKSFEGYERFPLKKIKFMLDESSSSNVIKKRKTHSGFERLKTRGSNIWSRKSDTTIIGS